MTWYLTWTIEKPSVLSRDEKEFPVARSRTSPASFVLEHRLLKARALVT